jgi:hypothetical protein
VAGGIWFLREGRDAGTKPFVNHLILAGSLGIVVAFIIAGDVFPRVPHNLQPMAGMLSPVFVVFILALALDKSRLSSVLNHPWLVTLGEISYALYILHVPVIWFYERWLASSSANPQAVMDATYYPLMLLVGLAAHYFVDQPIRRWLRNVMKRISMPLLLLDLAALSLAIYLSFRFRFGAGREFLEFRPTAYLMFWLAFVLRTAIAVYFNADNPVILGLPFVKMARPVAVSITAGSIVLAALMFGAYSLGWLPGFPRSVFLMDWAIMLTLSLLIRWVFRMARANRVPASVSG